VARLVCAWLTLVVLLAVLAAPPSSSAAITPLPSSWAIAVIVVFAAFAAIGTATSRLLSAVRAGAVVVDARATRWHLWWRVWAQGAVAAVVVGVACVGLSVTGTGRFAGALVGGIVGVAIGALVPVPKTAAPRSVGVWRWLILEGAVPTAVAAAVLGGAVSALRFGLEGVHGAGAISRMLAGTFLCEAMLGFGGFTKAWSERQHGLVVAPSTSLPEVPGPVFVALGLAAVTVIFGPKLLPSMAATSVIVIKVVSGAVVAGACSALGAIRGAAAASSKAPQSSVSS